MNVQERRGETLMNDLTMKRINEKYPVLVKCFQIAIYAIDARNRYFSVQSEDRKLLWNRGGFLAKHQWNILFNSKENEGCE